MRTSTKKSRKIQKMKKIGSLFFILLFGLQMAWAVNIKVDSEVDRNQMGIGDSFNCSSFSRVLLFTKSSR